MYKSNTLWTDSPPRNFNCAKLFSLVRDAGKCVCVPFYSWGPCSHWLVKQDGVCVCVPFFCKFLHLFLSPMAGLPLVFWILPLLCWTVAYRFLRMETVFYKIYQLFQASLHTFAPQLLLTVWSLEGCWRRLSIVWATGLYSYGPDAHGKWDQLWIILQK